MTSKYVLPAAEQFLSAASALYGRENNYDFVLVSLTDVMFEHLLCLNIIYQKVEKI